MRRSDYLRLREDQLSLSPGMSFWDTASLAELKTQEAHLVTRLLHDRQRRQVTDAQPSGFQAELEQLVRNTSSLLLYLRALCYLREHGIAPHWPHGSVAPASASLTPRPGVGPVAAS